MTTNQVLLKFLEEKKSKRLEKTKPEYKQFYTLGADMVIQAILNQNSNFGTWEVRRSEILFALLDEFVDMTQSDERCRMMDESLASL